MGASFLFSMNSTSTLWENGTDRNVDHRKRHWNCGSLYIWTEHWKESGTFLNPFIGMQSVTDCFFFRIFVLRVSNNRIFVYHSYLLLDSRCRGSFPRK